MKPNSADYIRYYCEREFDRQVTQKSEDRYLSHLHLTEKDTVLDVGCGGGQTLVAIGRRFKAKHLTGVDTEPRALEIARDQSKNEDFDISFVEASATSLPFENSSFSVVMANHVLMHLDVKLGLKELSRVLKPEGRMMIQCTSLPYYLENLFQYARKGSIGWYALYSVANGVSLSLLGKQWNFLGKQGNFQSLNSMRRLLNNVGLQIEYSLAERHPVLSRPELVLFCKKRFS